MSWIFRFGDNLHITDYIWISARSGTICNGFIGLLLWFAIFSETLFYKIERDDAVVAVETAWIW